MFGIRRLPIFPPEAPTVRQGRSASQTLLELPALLDLLFASSSTGRAHSRSHHQPLAVWPGPENTYSSKTKEKHHALHGVLLWYPAATYFPGLCTHGRCALRRSRFLQLPVLEQLRFAPPPTGRAHLRCVASQAQAQG